MTFRTNLSTGGTLRRLGLLALLAVAGLVIAAGAGAEGDAPGTLEFKTHNQMYDAHGKFEGWRFTRVDIPDGDLEQATVEIEIDLISVWEKADKLAAHLRTSDFFHVDMFPKATVKVDRVKKTGEGAYEAVATVDLHGQRAEVPVAFQVTGGDPYQVDGTATLSRAAFGIGQPYDAANDKSIVDDVEIHLSATLQ